MREGDRINTVLAVVEAEDAGVTLMHEHLFIDLSVWFEEPTAAEEAAIFLPSCTMCNLVAYFVHCMAGDEILIHEASHPVHSRYTGPDGPGRVRPGLTSMGREEVDA